MRKSGVCMSIVVTTSVSDGLVLLVCFGVEDEEGKFSVRACVFFLDWAGLGCSPLPGL